MHSLRDQLENAAHTTLRAEPERYKLITALLPDAIAQEARYRLGLKDAPRMITQAISNSVVITNSTDDFRQSMNKTSNPQTGRKKALEEFAECALSALVQVLYTTVPLIVLFIVTAVLNLDSAISVIGGSEAMFVAVIAFIDASRDSIRAVTLQSEKGETDKVDAMAIVSIILVVMALATLILSIIIDKHVIGMSGYRLGEFETFVQNTLALALAISWIYKFRLKRLENKLAKERSVASPPPPL